MMFFSKNDLYSQDGLYLEVVANKYYTVNRKTIFLAASIQCCWPFTPAAKDFFPQIDLSLKLSLSDIILSIHLVVITRKNGGLDIRHTVRLRSS